MCIIDGGKEFDGLVVEAGVMHLKDLLMCEATKSLHLCLQSVEGSGQTSSIAEGINEGEEGEADGLSADTESLAPSSRRVTEDSVISDMLGTQLMQPGNAQTTHILGKADHALLCTMIILCLTLAMMDDGSVCGLI